MTNEELDCIEQLETDNARLKEWKARAERWMWLQDIRPCDIAACNCGLWHGGEKSWEARYKDMKAERDEAQHERDRALEHYEQAMHRVAQLEAPNVKAEARP